MTLICQLLQRIFSIRRIGYFPIALFGIPVTETIVVPCYKRDVFHAGCFGNSYPFFCIKILRIKNMDQPAIFFNGNVSVVHHPFAVAQHAGCSPVNKHPKFIILELLPGCNICCSRCISLSRNSASCNYAYQCCKK